MVFDQQYLIPHITYVNKIPTIENIENNTTAESLTLQLKDSKIRHGTHYIYNLPFDPQEINGVFNLNSIDYNNDIQINGPYKGFTEVKTNIKLSFEAQYSTEIDFEKAIDETINGQTITEKVKNTISIKPNTASKYNEKGLKEFKSKNIDKLVLHIKTEFKRELMEVFKSSRKKAQNDGQYKNRNYFTFTDNVMNINYEGNNYTTKKRHGKTTYASRHYLLGAEDVGNLVDHLSNYKKIHCFICVSFFKFNEYSIVKILIPVYKTDKTNETGQEFLKLIEKTGGTKENVVNFSKFIEYNTPYIKYQSDKTDFKETNFILTSSKIHVNNDSIEWSKSLLNAAAPKDTNANNFINYKKGVVRHEDPSSSCQRISEIGNILFTKDLTKATSGLGFSNQINALNKSPFGQLLLGVMLLLILYTILTFVIFVFNNDVSRAFGRMFASLFDRLPSFNRLEKMNAAK